MNKIYLLYNIYDMFDVMGQSFIPKKNDIVDKKTAKPVDFTFVIALLIFIIAIIFSLSEVLYKKYLEKNINNSSIILERERSNFDSGSVNVFSRLSKRLSSSEELLENHIDLLGLFEELQKNTLVNIRFESLEIKLTDKGADIFMEGLARNYAAIVLQSDRFGENPFIINPIFSNLDVNDIGDITFSFEASLDKDLISYKKRIQ